MAEDARQIVERYFDAWTGGDWATARPLLHDDLSFRGPFDTFSSADDYTQAIQGLAPILERADKRKVIADGDDVCIVYDFVTRTPAGTAPIAECYHVRGGKIDAIEAFFDARPFAALRGG